jgi:hypothetical protein
LYANDYITVLFVMGPNWKEHVCPPTGEWKNELLYTGTMELYCTAIKGMNC